MKLKFVLSIFFILNCLFPYIYLIPLDIDAQPTAFILSVVLFFFYCKKIDKDNFLLFILFVISFIFLLFSNLSFASFRSFYSYASLFFITFVSYKTLLYLKGIPYKLFTFSVMLWFIVGFIQFFLYPNFCTFLLRSEQGGFGLVTGRGVTSLSTEPSYYGMICLLLLIILCLNFRYKNNFKLLFSFILIQLFIFSRSTTAVLVLTISIVIFLVYQGIKCNIRYLFFLLVFILMIYYLIISLLVYISDYRIGSIIINFLSNPFELSAFDGSVQERFSHVYFSLYGTVKNYSLPHGYDNFYFLNQNNFEFLDVSEMRFSRIMSAFGSVLYELGFFSLIFFYVFLKSVRVLIKVNINNLFCVLMLVIILFVGFTFSTSIIPFMFGNILFLKKEYEKSLIKL